jgi:hypothetical protein
MINDAKITIERLSFTISNSIVPLSVIFLFPGEDAASFFLVSIYTQSLFVLGWIFNIEYAADLMLSDRRELGRQNFVRLVMPALLAVGFQIFSLNKGLNKDIQFPLFAFTLLNELIANTKFFLSLQNRRRISVFLSLLQIGLILVTALTCGGDIVRFSYGLSVAGGIVVLISSRYVEAIFLPVGVSYVRDFFHQGSLGVFAVFILSKGDRFILPLMGVHLSAAYVMIASICDMVFQLIRQVAVIKGQFHVESLALGFVVAFSASCLYLYLKAAAFGWTSFIGMGPSISGFLLFWFIFHHSKHVHQKNPGK